MTFVRANPPGWALFELLTSGQMNTIDSQMPFALDGQSGGIYNPSDELVWNERWTIDASGGPATPGVALDVIAGPAAGSHGIRVVASTSGNKGILVLGGAGTVGVDSTGGVSGTAAAGGDGAVALGGNNVFGGAGGTGGAGIQATGGNGLAGGGRGGRFNGGDASPGIDGAGGFGITADGGDGDGVGTGGTAVNATGGDVTGAGQAGPGVVGVGGTSAGGPDGVGGAFGGGGTLGAGLIVAGAGVAAPVPSAGTGAYIKGGDPGGAATGLIVEGGPSGGTGIQVSASGIATALAVTAGGAGNGIDITALGGGFALNITSDTTSPVRAPLRMVAQDADPSTPVVGSIMFGSGSHAAGSVMRVYLNDPNPSWQNVVTSQGVQAVKAFAGANLNAGVVTQYPGLNLSAGIQGAGVASRVRFTFGLAVFTSANDYQPVLTVEPNAAPVPANGVISMLTAKTTTYYEFGLFDITTGLFIDLTATVMNVWTQVSGAI